VPVPNAQTGQMNELIGNLQASLAALRAAKPNPTQWSGPAANAFTHRIDLLEIELVVLSSLLAAASLKGIIAPGVAGAAGGFASGMGGAFGVGGYASAGGRVLSLSDLAMQLGLHF